MSIPFSFSVRTCEIGVPCMRSITITRCAQRSPVHRRHDKRRRVREVAPELACVRGLAHEISSCSTWRANSATTSAVAAACRRPKAARRGPPPCRARRDRARPASTPGPQHLHSHFGAVMKPREVDLRDRGACHRTRRIRQRVRRRCCRASAPSATASSEGNAGTWSCSFASSSAMSTGRRSRRVESTCPNLT